MARRKFSTIEEYIEASQKEVRSILKKIRFEIKRRLPTATETISYNIPAFKDQKTFVYFAAFKNHIGVFPPLRDKKFKGKLQPYMNDKGNLAFQLNAVVPVKLIGEIAVALCKQSAKQKRR